MLRKSLLVSTLAWLLGPIFSYATHLMGGQITYECIGPNQYRVTVKLYRDCGGIALENPIRLNYSSV